MNVLKALSALEVRMVVPSGDLQEGQTNNPHVGLRGVAPLCAPEVVVHMAPVSCRHTTIAIHIFPARPLMRIYCGAQ